MKSSVAKCFCLLRPVGVQKLLTQQCEEGQKEDRKCAEKRKGDDVMPLSLLPLHARQRCGGPLAIVARYKIWRANSSPKPTCLSSPKRDYYRKLSGPGSTMKR